MRTRARGTVALVKRLMPCFVWALGLCTPSRAFEKRWVYVTSNLYVDDNLPKLDTLFKRAADCGFNGILFSDFKTMTWWKLDAAERWRANAGRLRELAAKHSLELNVCVFPIGYSEALLWHDPDLAAGMPVRDAPLVRRGAFLKPVQTAAIRNGSFEEYARNRARYFSLQDGAGQGSFLDARVARHGKVSIRFDDPGKINGHGNARVSQEIAVKPWQQYRVRVWMKTDRLSAGMLQVLALAGGRTLQYQHLAALDGSRRRYAGSARELTTDWVEQSVAFNSLDNTSVRIYAGVWEGKTGRIWWDDLRIDAVPTLNLLRRQGVPLRIRAADGTEYEEGRDFEKVEDPGMGRHTWPGTYDTVHEPPRIRVTPNSRIREGADVLLSCYHASVIYDGQASCSLAAPGVFTLCAEQVRRLKQTLNPDGYFMSHDEIRCAGWEAQNRRPPLTTGQLLAENVRQCYAIARREGGGKPVYVWSDMFDPHHNAHAGYYLVNNTLEGSWEGLDPRVVIMKWGGGKRARPGLQFFAERGHRQMLAAYYDGNVEQDHRMWTDAARGIDGVIGVLYTTWRSNYEDLERFARAWWGGQPPAK